MIGVVLADGLGVLYRTWDIDIYICVCAYQIM